MIKKLAYILCFSLIGGTFTSCEDALLSQVNPNSLTDGSFWKTEADFDKAVNAFVWFFAVGICKWFRIDFRNAKK